jgi:hypothetical protein
MCGFQGRSSSPNDPYTRAFSKLRERLNERLIARDDYGLVTADEQSEHQETLQRQLAHEKEYGTGGYRGQVLERVLDTAHFVDPRLSRLTQLADLVSFVLRRRAGRLHEYDARMEAVMQRRAGPIYAAVPEPQGLYHTRISAAIKCPGNGRPPSGLCVVCPVVSAVGYSGGAGSLLGHSAGEAAGDAGGVGDCGAHDDCVCT